MRVAFEAEKLDYTKIFFLCLENEWEHRLTARKMAEVGASSVWTSGHVCDHNVSERCYTDIKLQPRIIFGWFWTGSGRQIPATNSTPPRWSNSPWGHTGAVTQVFKIW